MRRLSAAIVTLIAVAAACSGSDGATGDPVDSDLGVRSAAESGFNADRSQTAGGSWSGAPASDVRFVTALQDFDGCDGLLDHIRAEALAQVGPYGLRGEDGYGPGLFEDGVVMDTAESAPAAVAEQTSDGAGSDEFSGTNVQVVGVDEPDIVKTDGHRIVTMIRDTLAVVDIAGPEPFLAGRILLENRWGGELLLRGDRALVIANHYGDAGPFAGGKVGIAGRPTVIIDEILLDGEPRKGRSLQVEGRYVSSRSVDGTARVVIVSQPDQLGLVHSQSRVGEAIAVEMNRYVVSRSRLEDWLPDYLMVSSGGSVLEEGQLLECDRVYAPTEFSGFGSLAVLTFDLDASLTLGDAAATFAGGETIYASPENLYVATNTWIPAPFFDDDRLDEFDDIYSTSIHKFSLNAGGPATYEASGSVQGHLLNQFSLHEHDGHLFAAVTDGSPWWTRPGNVSSIHALRQEGTNLVTAGVVGDMGRGERIYAVRYIADRAYVVTFRQVDPLYVVDLADPSEPTVLGELKIPGFSAYLHPVGDGLLVGVGSDADETGRIEGAKVSLFDVSDPTAPREIDTWILADAESSVVWDHRAFLWWAPEQLMVLPVASWGHDGTSGAVAFRVTPAEGLHNLGLISHSTGRPVFATDCYHEFDSAASDESWEAPPLLLVCKPEQVGNPAGYECAEIVVDNSGGRSGDDVPADWSLDVDALPIDVRDGDRIELCWPEGPDSAEQVQRSLIVGDDIWTLSESRLQANDLGTLRLRTYLPLLY